MPIQAMNSAQKHIAHNLQNKSLLVVLNKSKSTFNKCTGKMFDIVYSGPSFGQVSQKIIWSKGCKECKHNSILEMLLKTIRYYARETLPPESAWDVLIVINEITSDITENRRVIWPWRGFDHKIFLNNYEGIAERLNARDPLVFTQKVLENSRMHISALYDAHKYS